jgi:hypothetical protein
LWRRHAGTDLQCCTASSSLSQHPPLPATSEIIPSMQPPPWMTSSMTSSATTTARSTRASDASDFPFLPQQSSPSLVRSPSYSPMPVGRDCRCAFRTPANVRRSLLLPAHPTLQLAARRGAFPDVQPNRSKLAAAVKFSAEEPRCVRATASIQVKQ